MDVRKVLKTEMTTYVSFEGLCKSIEIMNALSLSNKKEKRVDHLDFFGTKKGTAHADFRRLFNRQ